MSSVGQREGPVQRQHVLCYHDWRFFFQGWRAWERVGACVGARVGARVGSACGQSAWGGQSAWDARASEMRFVFRAGPGAHPRGLLRTFV